MVVYALFTLLTLNLQYSFKNRPIFLTTQTFKKKRNIWLLALLEKKALYSFLKFEQIYHCSSFYDSTIEVSDIEMNLTKVIHRLFNTYSKLNLIPSQDVSELGISWVKATGI